MAATESTPLPTLVHPDGREYEPSTAREATNLVNAQGYTLKDAGAELPDAFAEGMAKLERQRNKAAHKAEADAPVTEAVAEAAPAKLADAPVTGELKADPAPTAPAPTPAPTTEAPAPVLDAPATKGGKSSGKGTADSSTTATK